MDKLSEIAICLASLLFLAEATQNQTIESGNCIYFNQSTESHYMRVLNGFQIGQGITIEGFIKPTADRFSFTIMSNDYYYWFFSDPNITLRLSNLFEHVNKSSRNDPSNTFGSSDESTKTDKAIKIDIIRQEDDSVQVKIDDLDVLRIPPLIDSMMFVGREAFFTFFGVINVSSICKHDDVTNIQRTSNSRATNDLYGYIIIDRSMHIRKNISSILPEGFVEGKMLLIRGSVTPNATNAAVFIKNPFKRSGFNLYLDFEQKQIRLTITSEFDSWPNETQKTVPNKLKPNETFQIEIIPLVGAFLVIVNGAALPELPNELHVNLSSATLQIIGDVTVDAINYMKWNETRQAKIYPIPEQMSTDRAKCASYYQSVAINKNGLTNLSYGFDEGQMLTIIGKVEDGVEFFEVSILNSNHDLAFHLNVTVNGQLITNVNVSTTSDLYQLVKSTSYSFYYPPTNFKIVIFRQSADTFLVKANEQVFAGMVTKSHVKLTEMAYLDFSGNITINVVCYNRPATIIPSVDMLSNRCPHNLAKESLVGIITYLPQTFDEHNAILIHAKGAKYFVVKLSNQFQNQLLHLVFDIYNNTIEFTTDIDSKIIDEQRWIYSDETFLLRIKITANEYKISINENIATLPRNTTSYPQLVDIEGVNALLGVCLFKDNTNIDLVAYESGVHYESSQAVPRERVYGFVSNTDF